MTIERLLAFGDGWNRGDVDDIMSYFAADCTYHASAGPEPGRTYQGREAVRRGVIEMLAYDRDGRSRTGPAFVAAERGVIDPVVAQAERFSRSDGARCLVETAISALAEADPNS